MAKLAATLPPAADAGPEPPGGPRWLDVAPLLARASDAMAPGELLHADGFSLFESITAVEIGDPRMDAGADRDCRTAAELVAGGAAPQALSDAQIIGVMDRLAACEAAWHAGHFLPQSVYTCLYMLLPDRAQAMLPLAAFCNALRATCNTVRSLTLASNVCMDEDLMPHAFGLDIDDRFADVAGCDKPLAALSLAEDRLAAGSARGGSKQQPEKQPGKGAANGKAAGSDARADPAMRAALLARLRFRRNLHQALEKLQNFGAPPDLDSAAKHLVAAQGELRRVRESAGLGAHDAVIAAAFDAGVNRRQMAPTPPRSMPVPSPEEAWEHYEQLLQRLLGVCKLSGVSTWRQLQAFLRDFATKLPGSIERAALHVVLRGGKKAAGEPPPAGGPAWVPRPALLAAACGLPPGEPPCPEAKLFLEQGHHRGPASHRIAQMALLSLRLQTQNWCQAMCLNPARTRRRLRRLFEDWNNLGGHAANADAAPETLAALEAAGWRWQGLGAEDPQGPLGTWVEIETASAMLQHLLLGCAQQLYAPREFCSLYWYCDYLHGIALEGAHALVASAPPPQPPPPPEKAGGKKAGKGGGRGAKAAQRAAQEAAEEQLQRTMAVHWLEAGKAACQGLFRAAAGAHLAGTLPEPPGALPTATAQRFDQRFAAFRRLVRPEPLLHQQYAEAMDISGVTPEHLFTLAQDNLLQARAHAQALSAAASFRLTTSQLAELEALQKVAVRNAMALRVIAQARHSGDASLRLAWDFGPAHPWCSVISIKH